MTEEFELEIRPGTPDDYADALDVQQRAYALKEVPLYGGNIPPLSEMPETIAREEAEGKRLLVGTHDGKVVASLRMKTLEDGSIYFCRLSVDPDLQGRGIGKRMALAVEKLNPVAPSYVLECGDKSGENMYIYTKLGYRKTGREFQVPDGPYCLEMRKNNAECRMQNHYEIEHIL